MPTQTVTYALFYLLGAAASFVLVFLIDFYLWRNIHHPVGRHWQIALSISVVWPIGLPLFLLATSEYFASEPSKPPPEHVHKRVVPVGEERRV